MKKKKPATEAPTPKLVRFDSLKPGDWFRLSEYGDRPIMCCSSSIGRAVDIYGSGLATHRSDLVQPLSRTEVAAWLLKDGECEHLPEQK